MDFFVLRLGPVVQMRLTVLLASQSSAPSIAAIEALFDALTGSRHNERGLMNIGTIGRKQVDCKDKMSEIDLNDQI